MKMVRYNHDQNPRILEESWSSFIQQQQQQDPVATVQPPATGDPQQQQQQQQTPPEDPFSKIDPDLLDEAQVQALNAAKIQYAEALKAKAEMAATLEKTKSVASKYQSEADRAKAELQRLQPREEPKMSPEETAALELLHKHGVKGEEAMKQLPFFADMMRQSVALAKSQIGHDLGPMAGSVMQQAATAEFQMARGTSPQMQDNEVAQEVWDKFVLPSLQNGQAVSKEAIADYAKIVWVDKGKFGQHQQQQQAPPPPVFHQQQNSGFTFPGAQVLPPGNWNPPGQSQAPVVSAETNSAVTAVMSRLTSGTKIWPKGLAKPPQRR